MDFDNLPPDNALPETPFSADLRQVIDQLNNLAPSHVPKTLLICRCPVCMSGETLGRLLATPTRALPPDLLQDYSNSAHGDPTNPDDLNALLPRFLDLVVQDIAVHWNSVGADLRRFGDARDTLPGFPATGMAERLDRYADLLLHHFAALKVQGEEPVETLWSLLPFLLIGGWTVDTLTQSLDALFEQPDIGRPALVWFLSDMARNVTDGRLELWAFSRYRAAAAPGLAAWLNGLLTSDAAIEVLTDPTLQDDSALWLPPLTGLCGQITPAMLGAL